MNQSHTDCDPILDSSEHLRANWESNIPHECSFRVPQHREWKWDALQTYNKLSYITGIIFHMFNNSYGLGVNV